MADGRDMEDEIMNIMHSGSQEPADEGNIQDNIEDNIEDDGSQYLCLNQGEENIDDEVVVHY